MDPSADHEHEQIERLKRAMYSRELEDKIKNRPRRAFDSIRPAVGEDWKQPEEPLPKTIVAPQATMHVARAALRWVLGLSILFFLAATAFFGYYFTVGGGSVAASPSNIDISIAGPPQVAGGEPTELQVVVTNRNRVPLQLADLVITYPPGTRSPTDLSTDLSTQRISLGTIEPGGRRQGTISAVFAGSTGGDANVKVDLEYRVQGSSAIFVATSNYDSIFSSAPISVSVDGNSETVSGQPTEMTVTVTSNSNAPVHDVLLSAGFPFGFSMSSSDPTPAHGSLWELGDFGPGQKKQVTIRGTLTGASGDSRVFRFSTGTRTAPEHTSIDNQLASNSLTMQVSQAFLGLSVTANGKSGNGVVVTPGSPVNVYVAWQNNLTTAVTDAVIVAKLSGLPIDGTTVKSNDGFFRSSDNTILWDKTTSNGTLANLPAGAQGVVSFSFQVPSSDALKNARSPYVTISVNAAGKRVGESGVPESLQSAISQRIGLASDLQVVAQGLYYANPFGSVGPLPPKAGTETTYAIVFTVTNTTNKITNGKLVATLPPYVRWVGIYSPSSENVTFNQTDGTFTWNVGDVDPGVGVNGTSPRQAAVAIGFTPSTSQIGDTPVLMQNMTFTAVDSATNLAITKNLPDLSTDLTRISKSAEGIPMAADPGFNNSSAVVVR